MIPILLIIISISLIVSGNMPLLGGKKIRGMWVRIGGVFMLALSILTIFVSTKAFIFLFVLILGLYALVYFFVKGEEPTTNESDFNLSNSSKKELKTYFDAGKGLLMIPLVLGILYGCFMLVIWLIKVL